MPFEVVDEADEKAKLRKAVQLIRETIEGFARNEFSDGQVEVKAKITRYESEWTILTQPRRDSSFSLRPRQLPPPTTVMQVIIRGGLNLDKFDLKNLEVLVINRELVPTVKKLAAMLATVHGAENVKCRIVEEFES